MLLKRHIVFCLLLVNVCTSQNIDSLKLVLKNAKHDTARSNILNKLIETESNDDVWIEYVKQVKMISEKNMKIYPRGDSMHLFFKNSLASAIYNFGYYQQGKGDIPGGIEELYRGFRNAAGV